jgi:hypothetical protein
MTLTRTQQVINRDSNTTGTTLSYDELTFVTDITVSAVDIEVYRIYNEKELSVVSDALFALYRDTNYFNFFTLQALKRLTEETFDNEHYRDFILNVTERISSMLPYSEKDEDRLIRTIVRGICRNKSESSNSLIVKDVNDSIYVNPEVLETCLKANFWLIVVYIISIHFHKTEIYTISMKNT